MLQESLGQKTISDFREIIHEYKIRTVLSLFSGGRDSLVATHITEKAIKDLGVNFEVIHVDTTCSLPGVQDYVSEISEMLDWPTRVLHPKKDFWTLAEKWGAPSPRRRWCCYHLKLQPVREYMDETAPPRLEILGIRAKESAGRLNRAKQNQLKQLYLDVTKKAWAYNPIFWWDEADLEEYIKRNNLKVNSTYKNIGTSGECFCGTFKTVKELLQVRDIYPEFFQRLVELESNFHNNGSLFYISGKKIYARDLLRVDKQRLDLKLTL